MQKPIQIINGPNLNLLGTRQHEVYGTDTLDTMIRECTAVAEELGLAVVFFQSNHEGEIVDTIQRARDAAPGIIINAAAFTHTSVAILDALNAFSGPVFEVHVSNVFKREAFRHHSYVSQRADGVIAGLGLHGYALALRHLARILV